MNTIETFADGLMVNVDERGSGRPIMVLHGGGGPVSVSGLAARLAERAHVLTPTHPGFALQPRPDWFNSIGDLATAYLELLERRDLRDVLVIGSSMGGWIAAEMALRNSPRIGGVVLIDAIGIVVEGHQVVDVFSISREQLSALSFHNPAAFRIDPATLTPEQIAATAANFKALAVYGNAPEMSDPTLRQRLGETRLPALVVWGESDRVADTEYGREFAAAIPNARFEVIAGAGHLPQIEQPERLLALIRDFTD